MLGARRLTNFVVMGLLLSGCEKQYLADDGYIPEVAEIQAKETKNIHFFSCSPNFELDDATIQSISQVLKEAKNNGISNAGYMLISNRPIASKLQKNARKQIHKIMNDQGFLSSRVMDSGVCVYKEAKVGIKINILKYDVQGPDCSQWSEYIGDLDLNKNLPKLGAAAAYNFVQMIDNSADIISPRKYKGQDVKSAIAAAGIESTGSGSSSSLGNNSMGSSSGISSPSSTSSSSSSSSSMKSSSSTASSLSK
ncbi:MAG: CpaD family pilus assembly lipoprotein [Holosporaceae bacterium]|jgi:type IV pilus biogenesis protein CpaD/CtpE|nr:CpaD family pilus assembly lipoprotein [Holosporaceae bacterium]